MLLLAERAALAADGYPAPSIPPYPGAYPGPQYPGPYAAAPAPNPPVTTETSIVPAAKNDFESHGGQS